LIVDTASGVALTGNGATRCLRLLQDRPVFSRFYESPAGSATPEP